MVNEEIISPLPHLNLYLSFLILIIIVTTTPIYPSLTLELLYLFFTILTPFFSPFLRKSVYFLTFPPNLFTLLFSLLLSLLLLLFSFLLFRGLFSFFCTAISRRISGLSGAYFW